MKVYLDIKDANVDAIVVSEMKLIIDAKIGRESTGIIDAARTILEYYGGEE